VEELAERARRQNVAASTEILRGRSGIEIIREVIRERSDLLIKSAQPATGIQRILFGSTDRQLIRQCPCPVWIEKPSSGRPHDRILAAVDPASGLDDADVDPERQALNVSILEFALLLAEAEQAALDVVHVWPFYIEDYLQSRGGLTETAITEVARSIKQKHEDAVAELITPYAGRVAHVHVVRGQPAAEIARVAAGHMAEVVVMGTVCRTGVSGMIIGNTAETLLDQIDCSIVALKPEGFVSPVEAA
jgi:nucleotide-binding universal stress UspA family protein